MTQPKHVIAGTDFSDCAGHAAHRAAMLAAQAGATLTLLHVVNRSFLAGLQDLFGSPAHAGQALTADALRMLDEQAAQLHHRAGVSGMPTPQRKVALGSVHDELLAGSSGAALLVLGAHGDNPLRDLLIGSTAERLLRYAACPVLVVRRKPRGPYRRVLVPVDFSPASTAALDLAERFAPGAATTVVHAFDAPFEAKLRFAGVSQDAIQAHHDRAHRQALAKLANLERARRHRGLPAIVEREHPVRLILEAEKSRDADLIVIGRQGQSMVEEFLLGSVARRVLADAKCDVLVATGRIAAARVTDGRNTLA